MSLLWYTVTPVSTAWEERISSTDLSEIQNNNLKYLTSNYLELKQPPTQAERTLTESTDYVSSRCETEMRWQKEETYSLNFTAKLCPKYYALLLSEIRSREQDLNTQWHLYRLSPINSPLHPQGSKKAPWNRTRCRSLPHSHAHAQALGWLKRRSSC